MRSLPLKYQELHFQNLVPYTPSMCEVMCWRAQAPKPIVVWFLQRTVLLPAGQGHHLGTFSPNRKITPNRDRSLPVKPREN